MTSYYENNSSALIIAANTSVKAGDYQNAIALLNTYPHDLEGYPTIAKVMEFESQRIKAIENIATEYLKNKSKSYYYVLW